MTIRTFLASAFVTAAVCAQPAFAAPVTARQVDQDFGRLSQEGLRAFADVDVARRAIIEKDQKIATDALADANRTLARASKDNRQFLKAENELHPAAAIPAGHSGRLPSSVAVADPVLWLPVLGQYVISSQAKQSPGQQQAIAEANDLLKKGQPRTAAEGLEKAGVDVQFVLAIAPQQTFTADVYRASVLLEGGKTEEAVAALTGAQESLRFVSEDNVLGNVGKKPVPSHSAR
ncbi:YfdX family protein [Acetobacter sp.]|uniref:YfdX family protein n=1 Tax=Acetobacter sp. TaxID=440 RepID=UPI0025C2A193|nr:YfdX family protein [Acetobacter sp.]MCH4090296.1 YfdX family protein [Acetobacter sp.]MCI1298990.1 YfdX family protein [Acetobacter sp.]MCI1315010.1 YfdX family protein [Acetobacter sp.]